MISLFSKIFRIGIGIYDIPKNFLRIGIYDIPIPIHIPISIHIPIPKKVLITGLKHG